MGPEGGRLRRAVRFASQPHGAWLILGAAMTLATALILHAASGETFDIDEYFYFGRLVEDAGTLTQYHSLSLGYLLAPYNGHLQLGGKLIYEGLFALAGTNYVVFELFNIAALCTSVALVFELTRHRVGALTALAPCVLLLFLGFAAEVLLWPFDLHTLVSLAAGLGALLALRRGGRRGDLLACGLLIFSVATIELGLAILVGIAISVLLRPDRLRRAWIFLLPLVLYTAWWIWASRFHQSEIALSNLTHLLKTYLDALAAVSGALTGTSPVEPGIYGTTVTGTSRALAVLAVIVIAIRLWRGPVPRRFWVWLAVLATYWGFLALADRAPEGSRYIFAGAVGVLLVGAEALHGRVSKRLTAGIFIIVLIALPANVAQLLEGRDQDVLHKDASVSRTEFAMVELARDRVEPDYVVSSDPRVAAAGGGLFIGLPASAYLSGAERNGSLAYSLAELRGQPEKLRRIADAALVGALGLSLQAATPRAADKRGCRTFTPGPSGSPAHFPLPDGRTFLEVHGSQPAGVGLRRFASAGSGVALARLRPGGWATIAIPPDAAPEPWQAIVGGPVTACFAH